MKIIEPSVELIDAPNYEDILKKIELAGRVCYKSEHKITEGSAEPFVRGLIKRGHEAVIEHASLTVRFICDRGVSHEIVRHRLASYCQESTRYCNYSNEQFGGDVTFIRPPWVSADNYQVEGDLLWRNAMLAAEHYYFQLFNAGRTPQEARSVLPNSLKTEVIMTANMREWRHFLKLRTSKKAHPQMRQIALMLLEEVKKLYPVFFEDIEVET